MRHAAGLFALSLAAATTAVFAQPAKAPPAAAGPAAALSDRNALLSPIQVDSLTLTPIIATAAPAEGADDQLMVLDEAMAAKQVKIREVSDGTVNSLTFVNQAKHPVFVLAGEVILGGKQDRIIGRNTVIPANTTQEVPVYCVEHGRWTGDSKEFSTARALAHGRLRGQASYRAQPDVWNEVAAKNVARKTVNSSDTYRRVAQQQSDGTLSRMEKQVDEALARVPAADRSRMVGYAVALNGSVATVDVFGSPSLFKKLETKLIRSYLTEAVDIAANKDARPPTASDVKAFIADAEKAAEQKSYDTPAAATSVKGGERAFKAKVGYKLRKPAPPADGNAAAPAAAAVSEPTVYENYQRK